MGPSSIATNTVTDRKKFRPAVEALGTRTLPTSGLSASLVHGLLTIHGTAGADQIVLNLVGKGGPSSTLVLQGVGKYKLGKVHAIDIEGGDGDDVVAINDNGRAHVPARIVEGSGNVSIQGGSGADTIIVGDGNDTVTATAASSVTFGSGTDVINGVVHTTAVAPSPAPAPVATAPVVTTPVSTTPVSTTPTNPSPGSPVLPSAPTTPVSTTPTPAETVAQIIALTNQDRAANGLAALTVDPRLMQAAQISASNMATFQTMAHTIPGAADPTLQSRASAVGYSFSLLGENIAAYFADAASVESAWMGSTEHRANILDASFTQIGVAVAFDSNNQPYYAVVFGQPTS